MSSAPDFRAARAALKYGCSLIPVRMVRLPPGCRFRVDIHPPLEVTEDDTPETIMLLIHGLLEQWIRECPEQWFWARIAGRRRGVNDARM